ncbi:MAG TPA: helix-turn-helix domain-containing protein, partial [Ramlibacter sp.]|nr:helix-turn-helix domain-containing protein [Ramlibacter sp.]
MAASRSPGENGAADGGQSVRRALAVLRLVASGQERGVRLTDIAAMSGLSRPT